MHLLQVLRPVPWSLRQEPGPSRAGAALAHPVQLITLGIEGCDMRLESLPTPGLHDIQLALARQAKCADDMPCTARFCHQDSATIVTQCMQSCG